VAAGDGRILMNVAVAASGGHDSTALLHCTARMAANLGIQVHALHVHHGLQPEADAWQAQVAAQCRRWGGITFHAHRVTERPAPGDSIEAWARRVRYQALGDLARQAGCGLVLLAHHRRDQAETVLLQALRGAGPAGLAAMPALLQRDGLLWARPWLDQPREAIAAYLRRHRLRPVLDPSNEDGRYARSRLRTRLWPALLAHSNDAEAALAAVARRAQEARSIVDEVAQDDLARVADAQGLRIADWLRLNPARRANVLRHWLGGQTTSPRPETLIDRLLLELPQARAGRWPLAADAELRQHAGRLLAVVKPPAAAIGDPKPIDLSRAGTHPLPAWGGTLQVSPAAGSAGVPAALLRQAWLRPRGGGEQFQAHAGGVPRALKKQFQDAGVPAWQRGGPLVHAGGQLVYVPGLGLDARARQRPGRPRVTLQWLPGP
jgi:tRNA(Ile)-lysidine synthase